jgi:hypothetical protein
MSGDIRSQEFLFTLSSAWIVFSCWWTTFLTASSNEIVSPVYEYPQRSPFTERNWFWVPHPTVVSRGHSATSSRSLRMSFNTFRRRTAKRNANLVEVTYFPERCKSVPRSNYSKQSLIRIYEAETEIQGLFNPGQANLRHFLAWFQYLQLPSTQSESPLALNPFAPKSHVSF